MPDLFQHLAACDLALVQGGLSTTMELVATERPFLYFPLRRHFEQNCHVRHRLDRHGAARCMDFHTATPEGIADAIAEEIGKPVSYRDVETDGAARAAALIAEMSVTRPGLTAEAGPLLWARMARLTGTGRSPSSATCSRTSPAPMNALSSSASG